MKVLVIYPYSDKLLNALKEAIELRLGEFILVGDKSLIIEKCYKNNIRSKEFVIYDISDDLEVIDFCIDSLKDKTVDYLIFDDFPVLYQNKILKYEKDRDIGNVDVLDMPFLRHFLFVSNYSKNHNIDFEDKKVSILQAYELMKKIGLKKTNVALISNLNSKTDILEANIINMILRDSGINNINIFDNFNIYNLFLKDSKVNIYKNNINLLVLRNFEASRIFLDTLNAFTNIKIASFILGKTYAIDAKQIKDDNNIIFSLIILNKIHKSQGNINSIKARII
ncbi:MAG: hypothetical protein M0Q88_01390 [Bacilli bacterium]|nr:hypothetical protein [Bacilli bacterium]